MKKIHSRQASIRDQIAQEAARLLAGGELADYAGARRKAAQRLNCRDQRCMPDNQEIDKALRGYQRLFQRETQADNVNKLRGLALEAMQQLRELSPRLTGSVLDGTALSSAPVQLFVFADTPETVQIRLMELKIPTSLDEVILRHSDNRKHAHVCFSFQAGNTEIKLTLLSTADHSNPPLSPVSGRSDMGASLAQVEALLKNQMVD